MSMLENPTPFEEWMFQNAEGVETFPRDKMLEKAFNDGKELCDKQLTEAKELIKRVVEWADTDHPKEYFEWIVKDLKQFLKE